MTRYQEVSCPKCNSIKITKSGTNGQGKQRYYCRNSECKIKTFMLDYDYKACAYGMTEKIVEMAINGSGIRDTGRVLKINKNTVINRLKKKKVSSHR